MNKSYHTLNKIYGDPHIIALTNRINFIQKRRNKQLISIESTQAQDKNRSVLKQKSNYNQKTIATQQDTLRQNTKKSTQQRNSSRAILQQFKSARYRLTKQNSERMMLTIRENREKQMNLKRIKRSKVLVSQQIRRTKLEQFQKQKIRQIKIRNSKEWAQQQLQLKKLELKKQLLLQQDLYLNSFEQQLAQKSVLMQKIENLLHTQNYNI